MPLIVSSSSSLPLLVVVCSHFIDSRSGVVYLLGVIDALSSNLSQCLQLPVKMFCVSDIDSFMNSQKRAALSTLIYRRHRENSGIREAEHKCHLCLGNTDKSEIALYGLNMGHTIKFEETTLLHRSSNWREGAIYESLEIQLCARTMNKENGVALSEAWLPACVLMRSGISKCSCDQARCPLA